MKIFNVFLIVSIFFLDILYAQAKTYVVCAGISTYRYVNSLKLPDKDAKVMADLYTRNGAQVLLLQNEQATKANILSQLKTTFAKANTEDQVVFFFSGHGFPGGICPYDIKDTSTGISYQELKSALKGSKAKQKIIISDACYSGGIRSSDSQQSDIKSHQNGDPSVILFLSSRSGETSIEYPFMSNGIFTTCLLRGLKGGADSNGDKCVTAKEIFNFVKDGVIKKSKDRQHPVMWGSFDDNYIFISWK